MEERRSAESFPLLMQRMTREQLAVFAPRGLLVLPLGATEQHGPHLPVGTDCLQVEYIARQAAASVASNLPITVAPTLPFGSSHHHLPFGGTLSLDTGVYYRVLLDLGTSLARGGFRRVFLLNGHGGNHELAQLAARDLARDQTIDMAVESWWTIAQKGLLDAGAGRNGRVPGHAGAFETSLIMALEPDLVARSRPHRDAESADERASPAERRYRTELHGSWEQIGGYSDTPDAGSAQAGEAYLKVIVDAVAEAFVSFYEETRSRNL
jgi:creatinine amidohydrolase